MDTENQTPSAGATTLGILPSAPQLGSSALFADVLREVERAMTKFPTWPTDPLHALAVLGEEYGELTKEVLQMTYEPHKSSLDAVRTEAVQTAAMALRFLASLGTYEYRAGVQHAQSANAKLRDAGESGGEQH